MLKKLGALLLALTMAVACVPMTMAVAEEAVWFDLEAENGTLKKADGTVVTSPILNNDAASAGRYFVANDSFQGASSTMTFSRESEGTYDIWAILGVDGSNYIGSYTFTMDEEESAFYSKDVSHANVDAVGDALYTSDNIAGGSHAKPMKWVKIASKKVIGVGDHTLVASLTKAAGTDNKMGVIDVVRFVPSSWNWTPASNLDAPTYMEWLDLEVEKGSGVVTVDTNSATGRKFMVSQLYSSANKGSASTMTFEVPVAGNYDMWAVMSASNLNYVGGSTYTLDETDVLWSGDWSNAYAQAASDVLYSTGDLSGSHHPAEMRWVKIASNKAISLGEHTLVAAATKAANGNNASAMDVVRIVPSGWAWVPGNNFDAPTDMRPTIDANGILVLEAENGALTSNRIQVNDAASNGKYINSKNDANSSTMQFKAEKAAYYDVWAVFGVKGVDYLAEYEVSLDGNMFYEDNMIGANASATGNSLYTTIDLSGGGHSVDMKWVKTGTIKVEAGGHSITAAVGKEHRSSSTAVANGGNSYGAIDCVALIPAGMTFDVNGFDMTATNDDEWFDLEVENGEVKRPNNPFCTSSDAGDKYIFMNQSNQSNGMNGSTMAFYANEGEYDIWALVGIDDFENGDARLGTYKFYWGSEEAPFAQIENVKGAVSEWNPLYQSYFLAGGIATYMHWVKIASGVELSGSKILTADIAACANGNAMGAIDKVRIVPTAWNHVPTTTTAQPVKPEIIMGDFTMTDKVAGQAITATVTGMKKTVDAEKTAVVIVAAYKDDVLVDIGYSNIVTLTGEAQDISAFVTLPADITGYTVKAFLWNGLETGMPYVTPISK